MQEISSHARTKWNALRGEGHGWILLTIAAGWFAVLGIRFVIPAVLPQIRAEFEINNATAGLAITLIWAVYATTQFPAGSLVDRLGDRTVLLASLLISAASVLLFSVLPLFALFLVTCIVFGVGTGLYGPPRATVISNTFVDNDGTAFGIVMACGSVGAAIMPFLATLVAVRFGWRVAIGTFVPVFLVIGVGIWWALPRRTASTVERSDQTVRERIIAVRNAITRRSIALAVGAMVIMLFGYQGLSAFFPTYLIETKSLSQSAAGGLFALLFASAAVFRFVAGGLADRFGFERTLTLIAVVSVLPLLALPFVYGIVPLSILAVLLGIRSGLAPVSEAYILRILPDEVQGTAWGLIRTLLFGLGSTGSAFVGLLANYGLFDYAFFALAGLSGVAAVLYASLPE